MRGARSSDNKRSELTEPTDQLRVDNVDSNGAGSRSKGLTMFHDMRVHGKKADPKRQHRWQIMFRGARKINLWQHLPEPQLGSVADDWKATGDDLRRAMNQIAATCD